MFVTCPQCGFVQTVVDALGTRQVSCLKCRTTFAVGPTTPESMTRRTPCPVGANWLLGALAMFVAQVAIDLVATVDLVLGSAKVLERNPKFLAALCLVHFATFIAMLFVFIGAQSLRSGKSLGLVITALVADILLTALMAYRAMVAYGIITARAAIDAGVRDLAWAQITLAALGTILGVLAAVRVFSIIVQPDVQADFAEAKRQALIDPPERPPHQSH